MSQAKNTRRHPHAALLSGFGEFIKPFPCKTKEYKVGFVIFAHVRACSGHFCPQIASTTHTLLASALATHKTHIMEEFDTNFSVF